MLWHRAAVPYPFQLKSPPHVSIFCCPPLIQFIIKTYVFSQHCFIVIITQEKHVWISTVAIKKSIHKIIKKTCMTTKNGNNYFKSSWYKCDLRQVSQKLPQGVLTMLYSLIISSISVLVFSLSTSWKYETILLQIHTFRKRTVCVSCWDVTKKKLTAKTHHFGTKSGINLIHFLTLFLSAYAVAIFLDWKHIANITML